MHNKKSESRKKEILAFLRELCSLKKKIDFYNGLFCNKETVLKMNASEDCEFLSIIQSSVNDSVISGVARLFIDNRKYKDNFRLSIDFFIDEYKLEKDTLEELIRIREDVQSFNVKGYRNNYLSHSDYNVALGDKTEAHGMEGEDLKNLIDKSIGLFVRMYLSESGQDSKICLPDITFDYASQFLKKLDL